MTSTDPSADGPGTPATPRLRLELARSRTRRTLLRRRRPLAALLTCVAVGATLSAVSAPEASTVPVLVAARDLPAGSLLAPENVVSVGFRPGTPPEDALGDLAAVTGRLLAGPVGAGEPITTVRLVGADLAQAYPGRRAMPVRLPDPGMVALLDVGDEVDLIAASPEDGQVTTVAFAVPVLALPADDPGGSATTSGLPGSLLVVGLSPEQVAPVAQATLSAFVTFAWSGR